MQIEELKFSSQLEGILEIEVTPLPPRNQVTWKASQADLLPATNPCHLA